MSLIIPNKDNLPINNLLGKISIENGGINYLTIKDDIETHINVLSNFFDIGCTWNEKTKCTELKLGLIHSKILFGISNIFN